ncbi:putative F-box protein [Cardamine amara subsp. amara]|uniref:F-box protein n=1 Tax=Cardamine amara subsp. amara TaxID=228776 RepID=A0ABD1AUC9_CARAN
MAKMSNLPTDLEVEILSRVPVTSVRSIRSTCKKWNTLFKDGSVTKKHLAKREEGEFLEIVLLNLRLCLMSVNLNGILNGSDPCIRTIANLISLNDSDKLEITKVYNCEGLLLCVTEDYTKLVLWNPYTWQTRWISVESRSLPGKKCWYANALGYDKSTHKILRFFNVSDAPGWPYACEIYNVNSNTWRVFDFTPDWNVEFNDIGLSLKGNTYWHARDKLSGEASPDFLLCFDFTAERFVPRLPLPFRSYSAEDAVNLSIVREEQLAVLFQNGDFHNIGIWVTTKIEPYAVSWSKFFAVDMAPLTGFGFYDGGSFLVDEEKRAVVVFDQLFDESRNPSTDRHTAFFIGKNGGYFRKVDLGEIKDPKSLVLPHAFSYVPSSVQINPPA